MQKIIIGDRIYPMVTEFAPALYFTKTDFLPDRRQSSDIARQLLKIALKDSKIFCLNLEIEANDNGKPYFKARNDIFFNISHSKEYIICAIAPFEIGCDIEKIRDVKQSIANRFFTRDESNFVMDQDSFFRLWTLKESFVKAIGTGLNTPLNSFNIGLNLNPITVKYNSTKKYYYFLEPFIDNQCKCSICGPRELIDNPLKTTFIDSASI